MVTSIEDSSGSTTVEAKAGKWLQTPMAKRRNGKVTVFVSERVLRKVVKEEVEALKREKRSCRRYSAGWHRADGAQLALASLLRRLVSRKGGE